MLKRLWPFLLVASCSGGTPALAGDTVIHFVCNTATEARDVVHMIDEGDVIFNQTTLPGSCFWTSFFGDMPNRVGDIQEIVDVVDRSGIDRRGDAFIGRVVMHVDGKTYYSAGFIATS